MAAPDIPDITTLFREHAARVERTLRRLGVRESDVADATQEVFVVAHRKLPEFEGRASVSTWLYRIAVRVAAGQRRLARHRRELACERLTLSAVADVDLQADLERRLLLEHMADALDRLSEPQRAALALHELEGLRMHEVARRLGIPRKTAFSRMYAARRALALELRRLGYAVPFWLPFWPGRSGVFAIVQHAVARHSSSAVAQHASRLQGAARGVGSTPSAVIRGLRAAAASVGSPPWIAFCIALLAPVPALTPKIEPMLAAVPAAHEAPPLPRAQLAPPVRARALQPSAAKPVASRTPPRKRVPSALAPLHAAAAPALDEVEAPVTFIVTHMSSEDPRPQFEHPFASRLRPAAQGTQSLPPMAARLAPSAIDPQLPASFD